MRGPSNWSHRGSVLDLMADRVADEAIRLQLSLFTQFLFLHLMTRFCIRSLRSGEPRLLLLTFGFSILFGLVLYFGPRRIIRLAGLALLGIELILLFPNNSNHFFLEFICLAYLSMFDYEKPEEAVMLLHSLRWLLVIALFWSGLHKVLYGTYFRGSFLAYQVAETRTFAAVFQHILPPIEFHRVRALQDPGPYVFRSWIGLVVSNGTYVGEIGSAVLLCLKSFRRAGVAVALLLVAAIEVAARELMFGLLAVALTLLFVDRLWMKRFYTVALFVYVYLVLATLHLAPGIWFN